MTDGDWRGVRRFVDDDLPVVTALRQEAFRRPTALAMFRRDGFVLPDPATGELRAVLMAHRQRIALGGRCLPVAWITSVAVDPRHRGRGYLRALMRGVSAALAAESIPLLLLYHSSARAYRRVGFELAGHYLRYSAPLPELRPEPDIEIDYWHDADLPAIAECYREFACRNQGLLERGDDWWRERILVDTPPAPLHRYVARREGAVTGYVTFRQEPLHDGLGYRFRVVCGDLVWLDAPTARALLALLGGQRPLAREFVWSGPPADPLLAVCDQLDPAIAFAHPWMARPTDAALLLRALPYPADVSAALTLTVSDPLLPEAESDVPLHLNARGGAAEVTVQPVGRPQGVRLDVGALAALVTGYYGADQLAAAGRLTGTQIELSLLSRVFAAAPPWLMELA